MRKSVANFSSNTKPKPTIRHREGKLDFKSDPRSLFRGVFPQIQARVFEQSSIFTSDFLRFPFPLIFAGENFYRSAPVFRQSALSICEFVCLSTQGKTHFNAIYFPYFLFPFHRRGEGKTDRANLFIYVLTIK